MPTVEELYTTVDAKTATMRVVINNVVLGQVLGVDWNFAIGTVPTATVHVPFPAPTVAVYFRDISIDVGFNGVMQRVFTGKVLNVSNSERETLIECVGLSLFLDRPSEDAAVSINNITNIAAIQAVFAAAGIDNFTISIPSRTLGSNVSSLLEFQSFSEAITKIAEIDGGRWSELPTGTIRVFVADPIPQVGVARTYFTMNLTGLVESYPSDLTASDGRPRIRTIRRQEKIQLVKNRIHVRGATVTEEIAPGVTSTHDIEDTESAASLFVLAPDGTQGFNDMVFSNDLVDTEAMADEVSIRLLSLHNRPKVELALTIEGDPLRQLGDSIRVEDEKYSGATAQWFLESYSSKLSQRDFSTSLRLLGQGASTDIDPVAQFTWRVMHIVFDDLLYAIITFDGSVSFDPDGALASFAWSDNQGPALISGTDQIVTSCKVDPATDIATPWRVTLTVTDNDGNTDAITHEIDVALCQKPEVSEVFIPTIYAAFDSHYSGSSDGAQTWYDRAGTGVISVAAHPLIQGIVVFGRSDGGLFRSIDGGFTAPVNVLAAVGSPFVSITWDVVNLTDVWALTQAGEVYRSQDDGASWLLYRDLAVNWTLPNFRGGKILTIGSAVVVLGGEGETPGRPIITVDQFKSNTWIRALLGAELEADLIPATPSDLFIADGAFNGGFQQFELAIILNSSSHTPAIYYTTDLLSDGSQWTRALTPPANSRGRWIAADLAFDRFVMGFDDTVIYTGDVASGVITIAAAAAALDAGDAANHGLWVGQLSPDMGAVYLVSAEGIADGTIYLSCDRFATIDKVRPATGFPAPLAGMNAQQTTLGVKAMCPELYAQEEGTTFNVARLDFNVWSDLGTDPDGDDNWHLIFLNGVAYRIIASQSSPTQGGSYGRAERSIDIDGNVWVQIFDDSDPESRGIHSITIDAAGNLWAGEDNNASPSGSVPLRLYKSTDNGVTWFQVFTGFEFSNPAGDGNVRRVFDIACDPQDPNRLCLAVRRGFSTRAFMSSADGGVTWTGVDDVGGGSASVGHWITYGDSGRIINSRLGGIRVSDDNGASWAQKLTTSGKNGSTWVIKNPSDPTQLAACFNTGAGGFEVFISRTNGDSWESLVDESDLVPLGWGPGLPCWSGLFMADGSLVIGSRSGTEVWRNPAPFAIPAPAWQNWVYNLGSIFGSLGGQGIATSRVEQEP